MLSTSMDQHLKVDAFICQKGKKRLYMGFQSYSPIYSLSERKVERKEITGGTLRNCVKVIKTFCGVTHVAIPWQKISRCLPRAKRYADDRAPTIEEIRKIAKISNCIYDDLL
jgi:hypothetical protein